MGNLLKIIVKESIAYDALPKEVLEALMENPEYQVDANRRM